MSVIVRNQKTNLKALSFSAWLDHPYDSNVSAEPIARARPLASGTIDGVRKLASVDRKAATPDAFSQTRPETLKLIDPQVDPRLPFAGEALPVPACGDAIGGELGEFDADFFKRQSDPLRENNESDPAQHRSGVTAMSRASSLRCDEPTLLVEAQCR